MTDKEFMAEWYAKLPESRKKHLESFSQRHLGLIKTFGKMFNVEVDDDGGIQGLRTPEYQAYLDENGL